MKRRWRIFGLTLLGLLVVLVIYRTALTPTEPEYKGRKLTHWLADLRSGDPEIHTNGVVAIRQIGTNAIPFLVRMLHAKDSRLKVKCIDLAARQRWMKINYRFDFERRDDALRGLGALGPEAREAIPEISKLLNRGEDAQMAAHTLHQIGADAVPALKSGLNSTNERVRSEAAGFLALQKGSSDDAVPSLIKALKDPDSIVKSKAVRGLSRFPDQADTIVPALISCLDDSDATFRGNVARALVSFGDKAKPAIPKLLKMVESGDYHETEAATRALLKLDRPGVIQIYTQNLQSPEVRVRRKTAAALIS